MRVPHSRESSESESASPKCHLDRTCRRAGSGFPHVPVCLESTEGDRPPRERGLLVGRNSEVRRPLTTFELPPPFSEVPPSPSTEDPREFETIRNSRAFATRAGGRGRLIGRKAQSGVGRGVIFFASERERAALHSRGGTVDLDWPGPYGALGRALVYELRPEAEVPSLFESWDRRSKSRRERRRKAGRLVSVRAGL